MCLCACVCVHVRVCVCEAQVKVAPASSCVSGRIDHLIQIKDSPSARGRDELVTQCKIETYGRCRALVPEKELLCPNIPPLSCFCHSSRGGHLSSCCCLRLSIQTLHFSLCLKRQEERCGPVNYTVYTDCCQNRWNRKLPTTQCQQRKLAL